MVNDSSGVDGSACCRAGQDVGVDAVGGVDAGGVLGEVPRRQVQDRVGQRRVVALVFVLELADVVGERRRAAAGRREIAP